VTVCQREERNQRSMRSRYLGDFARPNILPLAIATAWLLAGPAPSRAFDGGQPHPEPLRFEIASVKPAGHMSGAPVLMAQAQGTPGSGLFPAQR